MDAPLINIITRCSRPELFERCRESVKSQTYQNINHIITFQNSDIEKFLDKFDGICKVRVPDLLKVPNAWLSMNYHISKENWVNPDWEFLDMKIVSEPINLEFPVDVVRYYGEKGWAESLGFSHRVNFPPFFPDWYCKIAERKVKEGWVMYLDDDDILADNGCLEHLVNQILENDEDTLHIYKLDVLYWKETNQVDIHKHYWELMRDKGLPLMLNEVGSNMVFNAKHIEYTAFDGWVGGDYRTAKALEQVTQRKNFIDKELVVALGSGSFKSLK